MASSTLSRWDRVSNRPRRAGRPRSGKDCPEWAVGGCNAYVASEHKHPARGQWV
ncbi:hypothetical protein GCM10027090_11860 [Sinomonas soli]